MTRYRWAASRKAEGFPARSACRVAGVRWQGFYAWHKRGRDLSVENHGEVELVAQIRRIHADPGAAYGSPRVCAQLRRQGVRVNHKRVEALMAINGICGVHKCRRPRYGQAATVRSAPADLVRRDFGVGGADSVWVGDITYIHTPKAGCTSLRCSTWGHGVSSVTRWPATFAPNSCATRCTPRLPPGATTPQAWCSCDRGIQYLSGDFADALKQHQMRHSVGRVANCLDNSVAESFFATLKRELTTQTRFTTQTQARREIFAWIGRYNNHRLNSSLNYQTPTESENHQQLAQAA